MRWRSGKTDIILKSSWRDQCRLIAAEEGGVWTKDRTSDAADLSGASLSLLKTHEAERSRSMRRLPPEMNRQIARRLEAYMSHTHDRLNFIGLERRIENGLSAPAINRETLAGAAPKWRCT